MDKTTTWLVRFTCGFIIFGGIFGALWRVSYVKNKERIENEEYLYNLRSENYVNFIKFCSEKKLFYNEFENVDEIVAACEEEYKKREENQEKVEPIF